MSELIATSVVVRGRVQGVWYRQSCAHEAARLGVSGWVRNQADGSVEGWFEGSRPAVEALVAWCRRGPELALVEEVVVAARAPERHERFVVLR